MSNTVDKMTTGGAWIGLLAWPSWWPTLEATSSWAAYMVPIVSLLLLTVQLVRWVRALLSDDDAPK